MSNWNVSNISQALFYLNVTNYQLITNIKQISKFKADFMNQCFYKNITRAHIKTLKVEDIFTLSIIFVSKLLYEKHVKKMHM